MIGERTVAHPAQRTQRDAFGRVKVLQDALGLTPAARSRMGGPDAPAVPVGNTVLSIRDRVQAARATGPGGAIGGEAKG